MAEARLAKICGLKREEDVEIAADAGAAFIGLNLVEASPRFVDLDHAARLSARAGPAKTVAVMVDPDDDAIGRALEEARFDFVQLHGREDEARVASVKERFGVGVIKAVRIADRNDVARARAFDAVADMTLLDAKPPKGAAYPGGHGKTFDWRLLEGLALTKPWALAGGLGPDNVGAALLRAGAPIVDVSSGVERAPGDKDPALIRAFLDEVRRASRDAALEEHGP